MKDRTTDKQLEVMTRLGINDKIKAVARELRAARRVVAAAESLEADLMGNADDRRGGGLVRIEERRVDALLAALNDGRVTPTVSVRYGNKSASFAITQCFYSEVEAFVQGDSGLQTFVSVLEAEIGTMDAEGCPEVGEIGWSLADQPENRAAAKLARDRLREYFVARGYA
jgi:hypothetical protein